jgi:hypothetical protein
MDRSLIDAATYVRAPALDVANTVALAVKLLNRVPKKPPAALHAAARTLRERTAALQQAWKAADAVQSAPVAPLDMALDAAWSALRARLEAWSGIENRVPGEAQRAAELTALLFPDGLRFTHLKIDAEWAQSEKRLALVKSEKLDPDLERLAGEPFVSAISAAHDAVGRARGLAGKERAVPAPAPDVASALRDARAAVAGYGLQLVAADALASAELDAAIRYSLAAIDEARAAQSRTAVSAPPAPSATPDTTLPEVPAPAPAPALAPAPVAAVTAPAAGATGPGGDPAAN